MGESECILRRAAKKNELAAELTFWYGIDAGALPKGRQVGLLANLSRVQAQDKIHKRLFNLEDTDAIRELFDAAYGQAGITDQAVLESSRAIMRRETNSG